MFTHLFLSLLVLGVAPLSATAAYDPVSEVDLACASQTFAAANLDKSVDGHVLSVGGRSFQHGVGTHAVSEIPVTVPSGAARFTGAVGVDDEVGAGKGAVKFRILSGDAVLWESQRLKAGDAPAVFDVPVPSSRHRKIYLQVDDLGSQEYDHADWVNLKWVQGPTPAAKPARRMTGAEFGLKAGVKDDQSAALRKAIAALREAPGSTLKLEKGDYHFWHTGALRRHIHISNHDQPVWQPVGVPLVDLKDVTIDGDGSTFVFHGLMQPVLIQDSEHVTVRGVGIDFERPHHSQGVITKVEPGSYELFLDPVKYPHEVRGGWFVQKGEGWTAGDSGYGIVFDGKTHEIVAGTGDFGYRGRLTDLGGGRYRVEKDLSRSRVKAGDLIAMRHSGRPHPGVVIYRSKDTVLEDSPIHSAAGMALLAQRSENIRISGGGVNLRSGSDRVFTSNADADHFSNCRGKVIVENALFEGMMDDAINVHATCLRIEERVSSDTIRCRYKHNQSVGFETFLPGETLRFIEAKHLTPRDTRKVKSVKKLSTEEVLITLDAPVPADLGVGDAVENADWFPSVVFRGNTVRNNRARGSLFTTPLPVVIEDNKFINSSGSAILLAGDVNGWYESGACRDVVIRKNLFRNNLTSRYQFTEALISIFPEIPDLKGQKEYYHRNVRIEDNTFETFDVPLVYAISTDGLSFAGNTVKYNRDYPGWNKEPFILRRCANVKIGDNSATYPPPAPWSIDSVKRELTPPESVEVR